MALLYLRKGGSGSGWYGPPRGTHLPSCEHIQTLGEARAYWREHLGGRLMRLTVHSGAREIPIKVRFNRNETHAFTRKAKAGEPIASFDDPARKRRPRTFMLERARLMSHILSTIEYPKVRFRNHGADLLCERRVGSWQYVVVLTWKAAARLYEFDSAYSMRIERIRELLRQQDRTKNNGPLQKSEPSSSGPSVIKAHSAGIAPTGGKPNAFGSCRYRKVSIVDALLPNKCTALPSEVAGISRVDDARLAKAIPPGARWITVHPNGADAKGQPVLVQEDKHGAYRVIGGAGGKLNYLKLRGVKSEQDYKQAVGERQKAKREARKEQRERDKAAGVAKQKTAAREGIKQQRVQAENAFINTVADAMDWDQSKLEFPAGEHGDLSDEALAAAERKHHRALLKDAHEAVDQQRKMLVTDADARSNASLGEIPLDARDAHVLSVQDLAPVKVHGGLGYATDYRSRAAERGLTEDALAAEKAAMEDKLPDEARERLANRRISAERIGEELKTFRPPKLDTHKLVEAKRAVDLLKAEKALRAIERQAREASKDVDAGPEPKAYVLEVSDAEALDAKVREDIENELRTVKTRAFLSEVGKLGGADYEATLGRHIGVGAYNAVNSLALAASGDALVERDVVDVLGVAGAAQVLARRLNNDMTSDELADIRQALETYHKDHYVQASADAIKAADEWMQVAKGIEVGNAKDGFDLVKQQELNAKRRDATEKAQEIVGTALGEMESNAALVMALGQGPKETVQASLGNVSTEDAIRRARAIGLDRGDYRIDKVGANVFLTVAGRGLDKLAKPVDKEDLARVRGALDIIEGRADEHDWLPGGIANRPDLAMHTSEGSAPRMAEPFTPGPDPAASIRDYIGGRSADGDPPADIIADLLSEDTVKQVGEHRDRYFEALDKIAPLKDEDGRMIRAESHSQAFEQLAEAFVKERYGNTRAPLHRQSFDVDQHAVDALHRALAEHPNGIAAFKPIGELDHHDQRALRDVFAREVAHADEATQQLRSDLQTLDGQEPEKETDDMFGRGTNPAWTDWRQRRDALAERLSAAGLDWPKYAKIMGGPAGAYAAVQDLVRSRVSRSFQSTFNTLNPDNALKLGRTVIRGNLNHLDAVDPVARENRLNAHRQLVDRLRERIAGRYASGGVADKLEHAREAMAAAEQSQMGFFAAADDAGEDKPLAADERYTLGHAAERRMAGMLPIVGQNFKPNQPTKLWQASMNGRFINQQRAVKLIGHNKRVALAQGVGSGKSLIGLAGFTDLHAQGKVKRGIFLVPSIVQGQFNGEALRYLEPGKYNWAINPGASRAERIAGYKNPDTHFSVVTHQSFRDDMLHLGAKQAGIGAGELSEKLAGMSGAERKAWMRDVMDKAGIDWQYLNVDEGHNLLNRKGKENSQLANIVDALSASTEYYVNATADPIKNDASEAFDVMRKMDPARYTDRGAFLRKYGVDTLASRTALRHEMARYFYPGRIDPGVKNDHREVKVALSDAQRTNLKAIDTAAARARLARMRATVDVDALRRLSPHSFESLDPARHEPTARALQKNIGILKNTAMRHALNAGADNAKTHRLADIANARRGQPGVVFAHSRDAVQRISERLRQDGHRVVTITGADSAKEKYRKKIAFRPEHGEAEADLLVASDAGAVGLNAQRGQWLVQYDTPDTAMVHAQRNGRIHRLGQKNDIELLDLVADHPAERKARSRLARKYALREVMTSPLEGLDDRGLAGYLNRVRAARNQATLF